MIPLQIKLEIVLFFKRILSVLLQKKSFDNVPFLLGLHLHMYINTDITRILVLYRFYYENSI